MYCPNCKQNFEGKFCPECGTKLIEEPQTTGAFNINLGDANAISGGINLTDRHDVTNIDNSVHHTTNNTTTVNNYQPEVFGASDVNIEELMEKAVEHYEDENYFKAFKIFNQIADKDIEALYYLGECYREGNGVMQDYDVAAKWYTKAASQGFPNAQYVLGRMLLEEEYGMQNIEKGLKTLNMAASQGNSDAMFYLGAAYLLGMYVEKDNDRAYHYFSKMKKDASDAVAYGYAVSCFENNPEKACEILKGANDRGSIDLDEMDELELAITKNGLLLWADILCKNICGYGKYDLGLKYYKFVSEHFGNTEAEERLKNLDNNWGFRNYGDYQSDGKGNYIVNDGVTDLVTEEHCRYKCLIPDDAISVIIPSSVTTIGYQAFINHDRLEQVSLPDSIKTIEEWAFAGCTNLKSITIPDSVKSIDSQAFANSALEEICIPDSVESIGSYAFEGCQKLKSVKLSKNLKSLGESAFSSCEKLSKIEITGPLTSIEEGTFSGCRMLSEVILPNTIEKIGENAFCDCNYLRNIILPANLKEIDSCAFKGTGFQEIVIPEGVEFVGNEAFGGCRKLSKVSLPSTIKTFASTDIFYDVKEVTVAEGLEANIDVKELFDDGVEITTMGRQNTTTAKASEKPLERASAQRVQSRVNEQTDALCQQVDATRQKIEDEVNKKVSSFASKLDSWFNKFK